VARGKSMSKEPHDFYVGDILVSHTGGFVRIILGKDKDTYYITCTNQDDNLKRTNMHVYCIEQVQAKQR
jgi:hypothetical protein